MNDLLDDIRSGLVAGAARHIRRRRTVRRLAVGGAALLAAVAIVVGGIGRDRTDAPAAFGVSEVGDGTIRVEVYPQFDQSEALRAELNAVGIDVDVITIRAHPSLDGVVEFVSHDQEALGAVQPERGELLIDPAAVTGPIEMLIYSTPPADTDLADWEPLWQASPSVFHPDEPLGGLHCAIAGPLTPEVLESYAADAGIEEIVWSSLTAPEPTEQRPDDNVVAAVMRSPTVLSAMVSPEPVDASHLSMNDGLHFSTSPECTPELAARWDSR